MIQAGYQYEFAELSFTEGIDKCSFADFRGCDGREDCGEANYDQSWVEILPTLGLQGWAVAGAMQYESGLHALLLQRRIIGIAPPYRSGE